MVSLMSILYFANVYEKQHVTCKYAYRNPGTAGRTYLKSKHEEFHGFGVTTTDYRDGIVVGHPPGGVVILWKDQQYVKPLDLNVNWCAAID